jgi:hypothetical protein
MNQLCFDLSPLVIPSKKLRVLVGCEYSGRVRDAFIALGHYAMSCDFLDTESPGPHYKGDVFNIINDGFDLFICHPPCTDLAVSGNASMGEKIRDGRTRKALDFVARLMAVDVPRFALENPISVISSNIRKPDQIIHPWQHGHGEVKRTCLWLRGLPCLYPSAVVAGRAPVVHHMSPGPDRWKNRSRTYSGIAAAMALQWGGIVNQGEK